MRKTHTMPLMDDSKQQVQSQAAGVQHVQHTPSGIPRHPTLGIDDIHTPAGVWASQEAQDTAASNAEVGGGQMHRLQISQCLSVIFLHFIKVLTDHNRTLTRYI